MVREPVVAGQFYPGDKKTLDKTVSELLEKAPKEKIPGRIIGIIVPHAGYQFSGGVAAYSYKLISDFKEQIKTVIMLGPSHQAYFPGAAVYRQGKWKTPLGEVEIDKSLAEKLIGSSPIIKDNIRAYSQEHSLEVQVPFLQKSLKDFSILPIMLSEPSFEECEILASAIMSIAKNESILLLASSDLYHGYSYEECVATDKRTLSYIEKLDGQGLEKALKESAAQACGGFPIVTLILTTKKMGADKAKVLKYTNSNEVMGERFGYCVGYSAVVFYKSA